MSFATKVGDDIQQFAAFPVDLTSSAVSPVAPTRGHAREIFINTVGGGTLAVVLAGSGGIVRTLTVAAGDRYQGEFLSIGAATNVGLLTVTW